jgi:hypothetical protein
MQIIEPPKEIFDRPEITPQDLVGRTTVVFKALRIEYPADGGILIHYEGCKYPKKGWPTQDGTWANNIVKRQTLLLIKMLSNKGITLPAVGFFFTPWKYKISFIENALKQYIHASNMVLQPYYLKPERYCIFCRELRKFITNIFIGIGISIPIAEDAGKILTHLFEYDEAYKYPLQDALTDIDWSGNIRKEINKALERITDRMLGSGISEKYTHFGKLLTLILIHPKIKKAFKIAVSLSNTNNLKLKDDDYYWCILRSEYKYRGRPYEQREKDWIDIHDGKPPLQYKIEIK